MPLHTDPLTSLAAAKTLNDGRQIPMLGLGTWQLDDGPECESSVRDALDVGYRHVDTALAYKNEASVGKAIRDFGDRDSVWLTSKYFGHNGKQNALDGIDQSLQNLGLDHVDLYLIHWPQDPTGFLDTWQGFEQMVHDGKARSIGVSNFMQPHLQTLLDACSIKPVLNQIETHPWLVQTRLHEFMRDHDIAPEGWSPLMMGQFTELGELKTIGEAHGKHPAQVLIRWALQLGSITIPKSTDRAHIESNADVFDFELSDEDMRTLNGLDQHKRLGPDPFEFDYDKMTKG